MHIVKRNDITDDVVSMTEGDAEDKLAGLLANGEGLAFEDEFKALIDGIVSQSHEL